MPELRVCLGIGKAGPSSSRASVMPGLTLVLLSRSRYSQGDTDVWVLWCRRESKMGSSSAGAQEAWVLSSLRS